MLVGTCLLIVDKKTGKILCLSRRNDPNQFSMPGGKVEEGETPLEGLRREVYEELGWYMSIYNLPFLEHCLSTSVQLKNLHIRDIMGNFLYVGEEIGGFITYCYVAEGFDLVNAQVFPEEGFRYKWLTWDELCDPGISPFYEFNKTVRTRYFGEQINSD